LWVFGKSNYLPVAVAYDIRGAGAAVDTPAVVLENVAVAFDSGHGNSAGVVESSEAVAVHLKNPGSSFVDSGPFYVFLSLSVRILYLF